MGRQRQHFVMQVIGEDEAAAREATFAELGSRHGVARRLIDIQSVQAISDEEAGPVIRKRLQG